MHFITRMKLGNSTDEPVFRYQFINRLNGDVSGYEYYANIRFIPREKKVKLSLFKRDSYTILHPYKDNLEQTFGSWQPIPDVGASVCIICNFSKRLAAVIESTSLTINQADPSDGVMTIMIWDNDYSIERYLLARGYHLDNIRGRRLVQRFRSYVAEWGLDFPINSANLPDRGMIEDLHTYSPYDAWDVFFRDTVDIEDAEVS